MVNYQAAGLDATFHVPSDPIRGAILARLGTGEASVTELAEPPHVSLPAFSKRIRALEMAGLLARRRAGQVRPLRLVPQPLRDVSAWIEHYRRFWEARFDALDRSLQEAQDRQLAGE
jgi:DNA-binding transcriptional ArsR family regulator